MKKFFILLCVIILIMGCENKMNLKDKYSENSVVKQIMNKVNIGMDKNHVETVLNGLNVENGYDDDQNKILSIVRDLQVKEVVKTDLQIIFQLNKEKRVESIEFKEVYTGP